MTRPTVATCAMSPGYVRGAWLTDRHAIPDLHILPVLAKVAASVQQSCICLPDMVGDIAASGAACVIGQGGSTTAAPANPWNATPRQTRPDSRIFAKRMRIVSTIRQRCATLLRLILGTAYQFRLSRD